MLIYRVGNLAVRGTALISKFIFMVYLGKYYSISDVGIYGLFLNTIGIAVYVLGLEFYSYSTREILAFDGPKQVVFIRDQVFFHALVYVVFLPAVIVVFLFGVLPWGMVAWFYPLLIMEHISQELSRLFITLYRPILSNVVFFIRSASWVYAVIAISFLTNIGHNLTLIWAGWTFGVALSILLGVKEIGKMDWSLAKKKAVDWEWIIKGINTSIPFFLSAMAYKVIELSDRYFIDYLRGKEEVGIYTFFNSFSSVVGIIIFTAIISLEQPAIISAYQKGKLEEYRLRFLKMVRRVLVSLVFILPIMILGMDLVLRYISKPEYQMEIQTFWVLLLSSIAYIIVSFLQLHLYVKKEDIALLYAVICGAVVNIILNWLWIPSGGVFGAAWATSISFMTMGLYLFFRILKLRGFKGVR